MRRHTRLQIIAIIILAACTSAQAQRILAVTQAQSASRDPARVYVQSVDMTLGTALPGPEPMPGATYTAPPILAQHTPRTPPIAIVSTGPATPNPPNLWTHASVIASVPFQRIADITFEPGWYQTAAAVLPRETHREAQLVTIAHRLDGDDSWKGRVELHPLPGTGPKPALRRWELQGAPVAALPLPDRQRILILSRGNHGHPPFITIIDPFQPGGQTKTIPIIDENSRLDAQPTGLALTQDRQHILILTSGYALDQPSGEAASWLHLFDPDTLQEPHPPIELPGAAQIANQPIHPTLGNACWIATQPPASRFAYATHIAITPLGLRKEAEVPLIGIATPVRIAPAPDNTDIAVATGNRLEIWNSEHTDIPSRLFPAPITALRWTPGALLLAEAARIHCIAPDTLDSRQIIQLQTGAVVDILPIPRTALRIPDKDADGLINIQEAQRGTIHTNPDTDGDTIPDATDPEPTTPSPRLTLPPAIEFHGENVGQEIKTIAITPPYAKYYSWRATIDPAQAPWLVMHPTAGPVPGVIYMGVDPTQYPPGATAQAQLQVQLQHTQTGLQAAASPRTVTIRVLPEKDTGIRRILWLWPQDATPPSFRTREPTHPLHTLAQYLAAPPYYFAHTQTNRPFQDPLEPYTIIVLTAPAAAQGALTRPALLDYILNGGALLILGQHLPRINHVELAQWMAPLGIQMQTHTLVQGAYTTNNPAPLCRNWETTQITGGCPIQTDDPNTILVETAAKDGAVFAARTYGHGRIAALAAPTPLENTALKTPHGRAFAKDLFQWLAGNQPGKHPQDMDADGIPDDIEDANGNEIADPGETDYLDPDTDGDGIPDGMEDTNLNGRVDEGETSPLNPDSDGDGIADGADHTPLPARGSPHIDRVRPANGPAEGGPTVLITGRNLPPDATVTFGDTPAPTLRVIDSNNILAEIPPAPKPTGGDVHVHVFSPAAALQATLPNGFHYDPRSRVRLSITEVTPPVNHNGAFSGTLALAIESLPPAAPTQLALLLRVEPQDNFQWNIPDDPPPGQPRQPRMIIRPTLNDRLLIVAFSGKENRVISGRILHLPWTCTPTTPLPKTIRIAIDNPNVTAPNKQLLDITAKDLTITLQPAL